MRALGLPRATAGMRTLGLSMLVMAALAQVALPSARAGAGRWTMAAGWSPPPYFQSGVSLSVGSSEELGTIAYIAIGGRGVFSSAFGGTAWIPQSSGTRDSRTVAADPLDPSVVYQGGGNGVWRSVDAGDTWQPAGLTGQTISQVVVKGGDGQTAYALVLPGGGGSTLWMTTNGGLNWTQLPQPGLSGVNGNAIAIDPVSGTLLVDAGVGLRKSVSGLGNDWSPVGNSPECQFSGVAISGSDWYAVAPLGCPLAAIGLQVYRSSDSGATWVPILSQPFGGILGYPAIAASGNRVILTRGDGIWTSSDGGATFSAGLSRDLTWVAFDPAEPTHVIASSSGGSVATSDDGGFTWTSGDTGLTQYQGYGLAIDPVAPGHLLAAASEVGFLSSDDAGSGWQKRGGLSVSGIAVAEDRLGTIYLGTHTGLLVSHDAGATFVPTSISSGEIDALSVSPLDGAVFAGASTGGLFESTNQGATWTDLSSSLPDSTINAIAIPPASPRTIYVGTNTVGVWRSSDAGVSWHATALGSGWVNALATDPAEPATVYAGTCGNDSTNVLKTVDGGATWTDSGTGLPTHCLNGIVADPQDTHLVYATSAGLGAFGSADGGASWYALSYGLADGALFGLVIDEPGTHLHAGSMVGALDYQFAADLWSTLTVTSQNVTAGAGETYTATFANDGPDDATDVHASIALPPGATGVSVASGTITCNTGTAVTCSLGTLEPGDSAIVKVTLNAPATPGPVQSTAGVTGARLDWDTSNNNVSLKGVVAPVRDSTVPAGLRLGGVGAKDPLARAFQLSRALHLGWSATDAGSGVVNYDLRVRTARIRGGFGPYRSLRTATLGRSLTYVGKPGTTACFGLRASDASGNTSAWTPDRCTAFPLAAATLGHPTTWTKGPIGPLGGSTLRTKASSPLHLAAVRARRLAIVAERCPGCGTIVVRFAGHRVATLRLGGRRLHEALLLIAPFTTARSGALTINSTTPGRPVQVDAVGISAV